MKMQISANKQQGAALVVGLILLVVITVLAISGMNTATTELAMARNDQSFEDAFQTAETGLEQILSQGQFNTNIGTTTTTTWNTHDLTTSMAFEDATPVPDKAFSLGAGSKISAYHFIATSSSKTHRSGGIATDRDSTATHTQAFYIVGPEAPAL